MMMPPPAASASRAASSERFAPAELRSTGTCLITRRIQPITGTPKMDAFARKCGMIPWLKR